MTCLVDLFPPLGLRISAGPIELGPITDDVMPEIVEVALAGVHDPDDMPFYVPWTEAPASELGANSLRFWWEARSRFTPAQWNLETVVRYEGQVVGCQAFSTKDFPVTRTGETGSWLGCEFHGRGIGTLMRQTMCAFAFDHLGATEVTSGAFVDNPASLGVSRKVGYQPNGEKRLMRRGEIAVNRGFVLHPDALARHPYPLVVEGLDAFRAFVGLDA